MPTESQLRDAALRRSIRQRIDAGELPLMLSKTISVGVGSGLDCLGCRQPIEREHIKRRGKTAPARKLTAVQRRFS